ncbi:MAG: hypothetical protein WCA98_17350 [Candidatus Acidiferrales bacterium]
MRRNLTSWALTVLFAAACHPAILRAQQQSDSTPPSQANAQEQHQLATGMRFLIATDGELGTKESKPGQAFQARTIEPLTAPDGSIIPVGAEVRGHVSRVEPGSTTGRARLWLSFDDIQTPHGRLPMIAEVTQVPGEHAVKPGENKEGEIEARTSAGTREFEAAAAGAVIAASAAAAKGATHSIPVIAAIGGVTGFLAASGFGQELVLQEGTKLELELLRPVYLAQR